MQPFVGWGGRSSLRSFEGQSLPMTLTTTPAFSKRSPQSSQILV